jgi:CBS domain containing-hemolysin-like protein
MNDWLELMLLGTWVLAVILGGLFSALSQSLRDVARPKMEELLASRGDGPTRARVAKVIEDLDGHATAVSLPRVVLNLIAVLGMVAWLSKARGQEFPTWVDMALGIAGTSVLIWIAGVVIPVAIARHAAEATVATYSGIIRLSYLIARPILALADLTDGIVGRLAGRSGLDQKTDLQEELLHVVEEASQEGEFDRFERDMIRAVVRFRDTSVAQIMTPRTQIDALPVTANLGQVVAFIRKGGRSRLPVYDGVLDKTLGVFYIKDLMKWLAGERGRGASGFDLRTLIRPAVFVPESKTVRELLEEMLQKRVHIAIVADEFGGTAGLVTLEDIFEEIFGDIQDEYEQVTPGEGEVTLDVPSRSAQVDARAYIDDANNQLKKIGVTIPESEDYDTVAGFVTVNMGRIPGPGEGFRQDRLVVTVLESEPTRVTRVKLSVLDPAVEGAAVANPAKSDLAQRVGERVAGQLVEKLAGGK